MTNFEKYKKEILKFGGDFALVEGKIKDCYDFKTNCSKCYFSENNRPNEGCTGAKFRWLYSEENIKDDKIIETCNNCKHKTKFKRLVDGEWEYGFVCTLFANEKDGFAMYLDRVDREIDFCECWQKEED